VATLQAALDQWAGLIAPQLGALANRSRIGSVPTSGFHGMIVKSPDPRAYQWPMGCLYSTTVEPRPRKRAARSAGKFLCTIPLMYQGGSETPSSAHADEYSRSATSWGLATWKARLRHHRRTCLQAMSEKERPAIIKLSSLQMMVVSLRRPHSRRTRPRGFGFFPVQSRRAPSVPRRPSRRVIRNSGNAWKNSFSLFCHCARLQWRGLRSRRAGQTHVQVLARPWSPHCRRGPAAQRPDGHPDQAPVSNKGADGGAGPKPVSEAARLSCIAEVSNDSTMFEKKEPLTPFSLSPG